MLKNFFDCCGSHYFRSGISPDNPPLTARVDGFATLPMVLDAVQSSERDLPDYLDVDHAKMKASMSRVPQLGDVPYPVQMEPNLVVEYYSR